MKSRIAILVVALAAVLVVVLGMREGEDPRYRFVAHFDTARGMVPGQLVKLAGSRIGRLERVSLTADNEARVEFAVEGQFGPFHDDASCKILPEGFISENFVECDPGTPGRPELPSAAGESLPTVPLARTEVAVQLQQVLDTYSLPVSERVRVILSELGIAASGRGRDLNALLRRANPALQSTRSALSVLAAQ